MSPRTHNGYADDADEGVRAVKPTRPERRASASMSVVTAFSRHMQRTYNAGFELAVANGWKHQAKFGEFCSLFLAPDGCWYVVDHTGTWGWEP